MGSPNKAPMLLPFGEPLPSRVPPGTNHGEEPYFLVFNPAFAQLTEPMIFHTILVNILRNLCFLAYNLANVVS